MRHSARALCEALSAADVTLHAPDRTRLVAAPRIRVHEELAVRIRRFKPELIGALQRAAARFATPTLGACRGCDSEFVHVSELLCPWCRSADVTGERPPAVANLFTADRVSARHPTVPTVPDCGKTPLSDVFRDSRTVRTLNQGL